MLLALLLQAAPADVDRAFLTREAARSEVRSVGFHYEVLASGPASGTSPTRASGVKVRYRGTLADGTEFDSSAGKPDGAAVFPLRGLIPRFQAALLMMRPGDRWRIVIPPELAYGSAGHRLSGRVLIFELELLDHAELPPSAPPTLTELPKR
jgi:FKBP-type peptidyl-prolyl cis-trans isomerase FklB